MKRLISLLLLISILLTAALSSCADNPDASENGGEVKNQPIPDDYEENDEHLYSDLENSTYGVFKKFAGSNNYEEFTKALNSAHTTKETKASLKRLHDEFGHYASLEIHNGVCYVAFMHGGQGGDAYYQDRYGITLATFSLKRVLSDDFDYNTDVTLRKFALIGEEFAGLTAASALNSPSLCIIGDNLYITAVFDIAEQGQWGVFAIEINTQTKQASKQVTDIYQVMLNYKGEILPLDNATMNKVYTEEGCPNIPSSCLILTSTDWSFYNGEYYSTVTSDTYDNGFIVKTKDFRTLDFVSIIKGNETGHEAATYVFDGKVYIATRQSWTTPYLLFFRYDLKTGEWTEPYKIEDGNSRPWIFEYNNELYLFNTIEEPGTGWRRYANISKIRTDTVAHTGRCAPVDVVATLFECGDHHSYFIYDGKIYFTATIGSRIHFGELKLKQYSTEKVNDRLIELFGDLE